ncbi:MAG: isochorismatase family protein, partial [Candidatus Polarisedimenticolia bacterium]
MTDTPRTSRTAPHRTALLRAPLHRAPLLRAAFFAVAAFAAASFGAAFAQTPPAPAPAAPDTALVVIDVQNFYFDGGRLPLVGSVEAARKARVLLDLFRAKGWPVIHVRHVPPEKLGADGQPADPQYAFRPE